MESQIPRRRSRRASVPRLPARAPPHRHRPHAAPGGAAGSADARGSGPERAGFPAAHTQPVGLWRVGRPRPFDRAARRRHLPRRQFHRAGRDDGCFRASRWRDRQAQRAAAGGRERRGAGECAGRPGRLLHRRDLHRPRRRAARRHRPHPRRRPCGPRLRSGRAGAAELRRQCARRLERRPHALRWRQFRHHRRPTTQQPCRDRPHHSPGDQVRSGRARHRWRGPRARGGRDAGLRWRRVQTARRPDAQRPGQGRK